VVLASRNFVTRIKSMNFEPNVVTNLSFLFYFCPPFVFGNSFQKSELKFPQAMFFSSDLYLKQTEQLAAVLSHTIKETCFITEPFAFAAN
jgi:hypothetical protein